MLEFISDSLEQNCANLGEIFGLPLNCDVIIRHFKLGGSNRNACLVYIDGLTDADTQNYAILQPLMLFNQNLSTTETPKKIADQLLPAHQPEIQREYQKIINGILDGNSVVMFDGSSEALVVETKGWKSRGVERPNIEPVIRGPQEAFTEHFRSNTATVRRYIKSPHLITEILRLGKYSNTQTALMYLKDIVDPQLLEDIRQSLENLNDSDNYIPESGTLEEYLESNTYSLFPQILSTERPDQLSAYLQKGYVGIVMSNSPFALIIPTNCSVFIHSSEDYYLRRPFGNFLRIIRIIAIFTALLLSGIYIAAVNYHPEMIPTTLLLSISVSRESVPLPITFELFLMELAFELIREAGIRVPGVIGSTMGLVGALVLGQAAVDAAIASPITIIVVALSALSSFVIPNYSAGFAIRILRFFFIFLGGSLGFWGIALGLLIILLHASGLYCFGIPFLAPLAPYYPRNDNQLLLPTVNRKKD